MSAATQILGGSGGAKQVRVSYLSTKAWDRVIRVSTKYCDLYLIVEHQGGPILNVTERLRNEVKRQVNQSIVSVAHLSRITDLSRTLIISNFIRGPKWCSAEELHKLATALDLNDFLLSDCPYYGPYVEGSFGRTVIQAPKGGKQTREFQRKLEQSEAFIRALGGKDLQTPSKRKRKGACRVFFRVTSSLLSDAGSLHSYGHGAFGGVISQFGKLCSLRRGEIICFSERLQEY